VSMNSDPAIEYVSSREFPVSLMQILAKRLVGRVSESEAESLAMDIAEDVHGYIDPRSLGGSERLAP
jgi:hypothetical protein